MKIFFLTVIYLFCHLILFSQSIDTTQLGTLVIRSVDQTFIKYKQKIEINDLNNSALLPISEENLNDVEKLKLQKIRDFIIEKDIILHSKKIDLAEQRLINHNKLELSLKIENNALSNTFRNIDKNIIKEEKNLQKQYQKLEKQNEEVVYIEKISNSKQASKVITKLYSQLLGNIPIALSPDSKPKIKSYNNKLKEVEPIELKESEPREDVRSLMKELIKIDERKPWEIIKSDSSNTLLTYTPQKFQNSYSETPFLTINSSIEKSGNEYLLNLKFVFSSRDVSKGYGQINKNDILKVDFLKSPSIRLTAIDNFNATLESYTGYTIYQTQYRFENKSDVKKLTSKHLDKVGVLWSLGYEEYPVYNLDFYF